MDVVYMVSAADNFRIADARLARSLERYFGQFDPPVPAMTAAPAPALAPALEPAPAEPTRAAAALVLEADAWDRMLREAALGPQRAREFAARRRARERLASTPAPRPPGDRAT